MELRKGLVLGACLLLALAGITRAQQQQDQKKRLLAIGMSAGFQHDSVSDAMATLWKLGKETGLWETYIRTDVELITKKPLKRNAKNLDYFDAIFFMTTGELPLDEEQKEALISFVRDDGKGFLGAHNATDTFYNWPAFGEMIGGYFDGHPWNIFPATILLIDREFPATRHFPKQFVIEDEIYQIKNFDVNKVRLLMKLDTSKVDMTRQGVRHKEIPIAWAKEYGKGRVFYCSLGHRREVWDRPDIQQMWVEAIKWAMGITKADAKPRPVEWSE